MRAINSIKLLHYTSIFIELTHMLAATNFGRIYIIVEMYTLLNVSKMQ